MASSELTAGFDAITGSRSRGSVALLAALPLIVLALCIVLARSRSRGWAEAAVFGAVAWGVALAFLTELLSIGDHLTTAGVALGWSVVGSAVAWGIWSQSERERRSEKTAGDWGRGERALVAATATLAGILALVALGSAPSTDDSMSYHLPRVMQWAQNANVGHFPTPYLPQLYQPPWAEFAIAHLQILSGGDRFANLIQWLAMAGCLVGIALIARSLGASNPGPILATVVAATIPMGIVQASSTQNDYVEAFWLASFAVLAIQRIETEGARQQTPPFALNECLLGASLGLAILTKGTAYFFAFPFVVWVAVAMIRARGPRAVAAGLRISALVFLLNAGHLARNTIVFGTPFATGSEDYTNAVLGPSVFVSNLVRGLSLHMGTPFDSLDQRIYNFVAWIHGYLGLGLSDPRTTAWGDFVINHLSTNEDVAGNLIHLLLTGIAVFAFMLERRRRFSPLLGHYLIALLAAVALWCTFARYQRWSSRHQLPLFVLFSPFVGTVVASLVSRRVVLSLGVGLLVASTPWVLFKKTAPLLPLRLLFGPSAPLSSLRLLRSDSVHPSIFEAARMEQYFWATGAADLRLPYLGAASFVRQQGIQDIGLGMPSAPWEYQMWVALRREIPFCRIEHLFVANASARTRAGPSVTQGHRRATICVHSSAADPSAIAPCGPRGLDEFSDGYGTFKRRWSSGPVDVFLSD